MDIFIYKDSGVASAAEAVAQSVIEIGCTPKYIDALELLNKGLDDAKVFVMTGGADLLYFKKLNGKGNAILSGFHFEITTDYLEKLTPKTQEDAARVKKMINSLKEENIL